MHVTHHVGVVKVWWDQYKAGIAVPGAKLSADDLETQHGVLIRSLVRVYYISCSHDVD